jgi:hypothetical protein
VDEYANKKKKPEAAAPPADGVEAPAAASANGHGPGSSNGAVELDSEFVGATQPKSSADLLQRRPVRNT